eukprot:gnl/MRDRNA2_/MRDRNA2_186007_c0_seq1.p1 gnl/MRDRNA2_/MRDRNA2_186007_c0~~gnl/MRDRNA2_/MRDRNA2_186007_c0_seq1.p1  ORF type:complete len:244 (-),score=46.88 gnl/MRDRNA2_/MRDRNA2_186007_c0_seq1:4-735(-)
MSDFQAAVKKFCFYTAAALCCFIVTNLPMVITAWKWWSNKQAARERAANSDDPYGLEPLEDEDQMPKDKVIRFPERFMDIRIDRESNPHAAHFMQEVFCELGADKNVRLMTASKLCFSLQQAFRSMDTKHCETSLRTGWRKLAKKCVPEAKGLPNGTDVKSPLVMKGLCQVVTHHTKVLETAFLEAMCPLKPNGKKDKACRDQFDEAWVTVVQKCLQHWKTDDNWLKIAREKAAKSATAGHEL